MMPVEQGRAGSLILRPGVLRPPSSISIRPVSAVAARRPRAVSLLKPRSTPGNHPILVSLSRVVVRQVDHAEQGHGALELDTAQSLADC
jgi:hypothetical protein